MEIRKDLPFPYCDECEEFVLKVDDHLLFYGNGSERVLTVRCKNANKCLHLKRNLDRKEAENADKI